MLLKIKRVGQLVHNILREHKGAIVINGSVSIGYDELPIDSNWGDDINYYFLREIIDGDIVFYSQASLAKWFDRPNYAVIGSIIGSHTDSKSIIWGAGVMNSTLRSIPHPKKICAVRGPLTRTKLIEMGIDCPEVYGDPAMLLPMYYTSRVKKKYKLGIIPHYVDYESVSTMFQSVSEVNVIDIRHWDTWTDFIDRICECEVVISSSLHGLIVANAYNIPSAWVEFAGSESRDRFKYHDFYQSLNTDKEPIIIRDVADIRKAAELADINMIDLKPLIECAPFKLNI